VSGVRIDSACHAVGSPVRGGVWELNLSALPPLTESGISSYQGLLDGTTVDNLNVLDTSKTNDTSGVEWITLQEVANALFPTTNATQTLTIDSSFWSGNLHLTFETSPGSGIYYTIWATSAGSFDLAQTDQLGNYNSSLVASASFNDTATTTSTKISSFLNWVTSTTGASLSSASFLVTADIDGGAGKDNIQGISNNTTVHNIIQGGAGADILSGGTGSDYFVYTSTSDSPAAGQLNSGGQLAQTWDQITNFSSVQGDKIDLSAFGGLVWNGTGGAIAGKDTVWYGSDGAGGIYLYTSSNGQPGLKIDLANVTSLKTSDIIGVNLGAPTITSVTDDVGKFQGSLLNGAVTDDSTPTFHISFAGTSAAAGDTVQIYDGSTKIGIRLCSRATISRTA
jgi:hypothetical protein